MNDIQKLAQQLKPYIVQWKLQASTTNVVVTTAAPTSVAWSAINFAGSSLTDIVNRPHAALSGLSNDDHTQYVRQTGRGSIAYIDAFLRVRDITDSRYRSDHYVTSATGTVINSFDDTGITYLPLSFDATSINLRPDGANGLTIDTNSIWYSGITSINTDNYASQTAGLHLGYDGSIDCRYLYTEQLHAKAFIADLEQALAGGQIISKSVTILDQPFTAPYPGFSKPLIVKDLPSAHGMQVFQANDFIRVRQFSRSGGSLNVDDCWGQVTSPTDNGNGTQTWSFTRSGTATYNTIAFVAASGTAGSSTSITVNKPIGTSSGYTMLANVSYTGSPTITPPSDWIYLWTYSNGSSININAYYKYAGGSEPSTYAWGFSTSTNASISVATYSGVGYFGTLIDASSAQPNSSTTNMTAPTLTPNTPADMLVFFGATQNIRATPPAGMTERTDIGSSSAGSYIADVLLSSGSATGSKTATLASSSNSIGALIALIASPASMSSTAGAMTPYSTIAADAIILDYGVSGNGYAEVTTVDGNYGANSPYYQIVTWTTHPATGATVKMRLGNLTGITDTSFSSFSGKYGLYTSDSYLKGDLETGGGYIRVYQASGINIQEDTWGSWDHKRALQWWPDITSMSGSPSLAMYTGKVSGGFTANQNFGYIDCNPTGSVAAALTLTAFHQGTSNDAAILLQGGSQSIGSSSNITATADSITLSGPTGVSTITVSSALQVPATINDEKFALDSSANTFNVSAGASLPFSASGAFSGLVMIIEPATGNSGLYLVSGGNVVLITSTGGVWTANTTTGSNQFDVSYVSSKYQFKNKYASTKTFNIMALRVRNAA